ncbi:MAG: MarR family transcriptional regulator [Gammaproteobacteria bacterium]|nr:MarR family transcriptional regulator [Gammaproteobacteria bacterium]
MKPTQTGGLFTQVVLEIFKVGGMLNVEGDQLTKEFGLTSSRWKILGAVGMSPIPLTVPQIGRSMGQSRQAVQRLVDVMIKDGFLQLIDNPNHKRAKYIGVTSKAKEIYRQLDNKQIPWADQCSSELTKSELETTLDVLRKISLQLGA